MTAINHLRWFSPNQGVYVVMPQLNNIHCGISMFAGWLHLKGRVDLDIGAHLYIQSLYGLRVGPGQSNR
jgi:hypothetical protein